MQTMALGVGRLPINLHITSTQTTLYNVFTEAGSPTAACDLVLTIDPGVVLEAGLTEGGLPIGSTFRINKAESTPGAGDGAIIAGVGGGRNGNTGDGGTGTHSLVLSGQPGQPGGDAITLVNCDVTIDNTGGFIRAGGGQGGGGGGTYNTASSDGAGGGGGGGGRGYNNATAGQGATGESGHDGSNGVAGSSSSAGAGGSGAVGTKVHGGTGGNGGDFGQPGADGADGVGETTGSGAAGGAAGKAVALNGHACTFIGGNDATHVKGAVA